MSGTAVLFAHSAQAPALRRGFSPLQWTAIGGLAIPLWALWPSLAIRTAAVPPLETLTLMFLCGFLSFTVLHALAGDERRAGRAGGCAAGYRPWCTRRHSPAETCAFSWPRTGCPRRRRICSPICGRS